MDEMDSQGWTKLIVVLFTSICALYEGISGGGRLRTPSSKKTSNAYLHKPG